MSLSADGNTAIVGGLTTVTLGPPGSGRRSGGVWTQQGPKLVGSGAGGCAARLVGVPLRRRQHGHRRGGWGQCSAGAAWVWTRSGGVWTQQGSKLVGTGAVGGAKQGVSVSLSADGNTAIVGGHGDNNGAGAAWVFTRP